jgi:hypothetical protein
MSTEARAPRQQGTMLGRHAHKLHLVLAFAMLRLSRTAAGPEGTLAARLRPAFLACKLLEYKTIAARAEFFFSTLPRAASRGERPTY